MKFSLRVGWLGLTAGTACFSQNRGGHAQPTTAQAADVLLVSGERTCEGDPSQLPAERDLNQLFLSLSRMAGQPKVDVFRNASSETLVNYLAADNQRPLIVFYTGHGQVQNWRSELCLRDGPVATEYLLAHVSKARPSTAWFVNACSSAFVDVRYASVPSSVVTVATSQFKTDPLRPSVAVDAFSKALTIGDRNRDGLITDEDLFRQMQQHIALDRQRDAALRLHLRRQAAVPIPLFSTKSLARSIPWAFNVAGEQVPEILPALRFHRDILDDLRHPLPSALLRVDVESTPLTRGLDDEDRLTGLAQFTPFARLWLRAEHGQTAFDLREKRYVSPSEQLIAVEGGQVLNDAQLGSYLYVEGMVGQAGQLLIGGQHWILERLMAIPCPRALVGQCFVQTNGDENDKGSKQ